MTQDQNHSFLAEELLVPNANKIDGPRLNMVCNHLNQALVLDEPEKPLVFTNFENQVGEVSSAIVRYKHDVKVLKKIKKTEACYAIITEDTETGEIDCKEITTSKHLNEHYGYINSTVPFDNIEEGAIFKKGETLSIASTYDECENFGYGRNLKTIFYNHKNGTFEDAIVVSETAAKKMSFTEIIEYGVLINSNDVLLNLYGDENNYKCFPDTFEEIENGIVCARRRFEKRSSFAKFSDHTANKILASDAVFNGKGYIEDVTVYSNVPADKLSEPWAKQIKDILDRQEAYWLEVIEALWPYKDSGKLSADASYTLARYVDSVDGPHSTKRPWIAKNEFDFVHLVIKICRTRPLEIGCKITNRYGSKGVISMILPDEEMPTTVDGEHAEVCISPLGVIGRENPGALFELELNQIADSFRKRHMNDDLEGKIEGIHDAYKCLNFDQYYSFDEFLETLDDEDKAKFVDELYQNGFPIHVSPFFGNLGFQELADIIEDSKTEQSKFIGIDRPLTFAKAYFIRLKQEPSGKQSARCVDLLSSKGVPNKNNSKKATDVLSKTPIRFGEQESSNVMFTGKEEDIFDLLSFDSQSSTDRIRLAKALLNKKEGEEIKLQRSGTDVPKNMLNGYLSGLGLKIEK